MKRALALLDKPSPDSFGMNPVAIDDGGRIHVAGLARASSHRGRGLDATEVEQLIRGGHALRLNGDELLENWSDDTVALWLGNTFIKKAESLDLSPPPLPKTARSAEGGTFYLGPAAAMYPYLDCWTIAAFRRFRSLSNDRTTQRAIASLMRWVLPDRAEVMAALWETSPNQRRELEIQLRTFARGKNADALRRQHAASLDSRDPLAELRLVVFTGHTGTDRNAVAQRFADRFALAQPATFRHPIVEHVGAADMEAARREKREKRILMDEGQAQVEESPLALALAALRSTQLDQKIVVLDSLRHSSIRETLRWLQPRKLVVVAVTADLELRRKKVADNGENPDEIFAHPTESEIDLLAADADKTVQYATVVDGDLREIFDVASQG